MIAGFHRHRLYPLFLSTSGKNWGYISTFERNPNFDFFLWKRGECR